MRGTARDVTEKFLDFAVGKPVIGSSLGKAPDARDETEMTHTMLGADRATHFKILAIAMAGATAVALVGMNAAVPGSDAAAGRAQASSAVLKAGKPTISAALDATTIR
jgi:hypothetical protein